jgi:DNA replication protein DnaC
VTDAIHCRECWLVHSATTACGLDAVALSRTDEGRAELKRRQNAAYARHGAARGATGYAEAWRWAQKAGAPYEALSALREGPDDSAALAAARKFNRDGEALALVLLGPTGVGKTLAASLVAVDFAARWPWNEQPSGGAVEPIRYVAAATLTRLSAYDAAAQHHVESLQRCQLLVLEDAGDEGTDLGRGLFVELLMARHAARRRTVITGNLRPSTFRERYGAAVADRIRSSGYAPDLFAEKSRRRRARPATKTEAET